MRKYLAYFFGFDKREINGFLGVLFLLILALMLPFAIDKYTDPNGYAIALDSIIEHTNTNWKVEKKEGSPKPRSNLRLKMRLFDPNTVTKEELQQMQLPAFFSKNLTRYIEKGGNIHTTPELKRIYGMDSQLYVSVAPFVRIKKQKERQKHNTIATSPVSTQQSSSILVQKDLNLMDTSQLMALHGIGPVLSKRIVKFKNALGGFYSMQQVGEIYGLDARAKNSLYQHCFVEQSAVSTLNINTLPDSLLFAHPYISRHVAKAIVAFRNQHGNYNNVKEIQRIILVDSLLFNKIRIYLTTE